MNPHEREALAASVLDLRSACATLVRLRQARPRLRQIEAGQVRAQPTNAAAPLLEDVLSTTLDAFANAQITLRQRGLALSRTAPIHVRMHGELCELDTEADVVRVRLQLQHSSSPTTPETAP